MRGDSIAHVSTAPFQWSRRSYLTALRACHNLGAWRRAIVLIRELLPEGDFARDELAPYGDVDRNDEYVVADALESGYFCSAMSACLTSRDPEARPCPPAQVTRPPLVATVKPSFFLPGT